MLTSVLLIALLGQATDGKRPADIPYRLLRSEIPQRSDRLKEASFAVSVDRPLSRENVQILICRILIKEQPPRFEKLNILVFVDLDEYIPSNGSALLEQKNTAHQLAWYVWNGKLPKVRGRLVMIKDTDGNPLDQLQSREFDLEKNCR